MSEKEELKIIQLLNSQNNRERETGVKLFISVYEKRAKIWLQKMGHKEDLEDIWIESAHMMVRAVHTGLYQKIPGIAMYTYFHTILMGTSIKYAKEKKKRNEFLSHLGKNEMLYENKTPDKYLELVEYLDALDYCLRKFNREDRKLLEDVMLLGKKLYDLIEEYGLKNKNNAKQKYFKLKLILKSCLNTKGI